MKIIHRLNPKTAGPRKESGRSAKPSNYQSSLKAKVLGVSRTTLSRLINGQAGVSPEMAIRLVKAFGATPDIRIRMQSAYDLAQARLHEKFIRVNLYQPPPMA